MHHMICKQVREVQEPQVLVAVATVDVVLQELPAVSHVDAMEGSVPPKPAVFG